MRGTLVVTAACVALLSTTAVSQKQKSAEIIGHILAPERLTPSADRLAGVRLPDGFRLSVFAEGLENPRMIAVAADGTVYVTQRESGSCVMLRDTDRDGRADQRRVVARRPQMHGIAIDGSTVYLTTVREVFKATRQPDGSLTELVRIIDDLPHGGQHPNRTIAIGPDGMLYISVGSTCNACDETGQVFATILRGKPDGSNRMVFASGLRNTIGFGWHPQTGALWGMDHGIDWLGDDEQVEELNLIEEGSRYGWPYIYGDGKSNLQDEPPGGLTSEQWNRLSKRPALGYTPHSAPMQMVFYTGDQFPAEYRGDAFIAMRGSWNRKNPSGYEVVRVRFRDGEPKTFEPFVTGFLVDQGAGRFGHLGRLAGLAQAADGSLLLGDDENGVIYRIAYAR